MGGRALAVRVAQPIMSVAEASSAVLQLTRLALVDPSGTYDHCVRRRADVMGQFPAEAKLARSFSDRQRPDIQCSPCGTHTALVLQTRSQRTCAFYASREG